jgi:hypothetical protein
VRAAPGLTGSQRLGERFAGGCLVAGYDVAPRSAESLLEVTHMHLPMFALVLLLLTHLLVFAPVHNARKAALIVASFASALLMEGAGWLTRFVGPEFAWLKVFAFVAFQLLLGGLIVGLALLVARGPKHHKKVP